MEIYKKDKKVRSKKLKAKVDLTAMVSVSFLLIVFFMVTTELGKPKALSLGLPDERDCGPRTIACFDSNRFLTILLGDNDEMIVYQGFIGDSINFPKKPICNKVEIRKEILNKNKAIIQYSTNFGKPKNGAIVVIKPSNKSNYGNLVNILDVMEIAGIKTYVIQNDFTPEESELLAVN